MQALSRAALRGFAGAGALAAAGAAGAAKATPAEAETLKHETSRLFRFGLIADIQYADIPDATNFAGTETRMYRGTIECTRTAVAGWNALEPQPLFVGQLGDMIDGQNAGKYGAGIELGWDKEPQTAMAFERVMHELNQCEMPLYHAIGNHELYNFDWAELSEKLNVDGRHTVSREGRFYFSFRPHPGWTVIMLNPYEVSIMQATESDGYKSAAEVLKKHNPNDVISGQGNVNFFEGTNHAPLWSAPRTPPTRAICRAARARPCAALTTPPSAVCAQGCPASSYGMCLSTGG